MRAYEPRPVVIGYDGSATSQAALRWAAREARLRYAPLLVCHAWRWAFPTPPSDLRALDHMRHLADTVLAHGVTLARGFAPHTEVRRSLEQGSPAAVLLAESSAAELVVIGTGGRRAHLGSTALQVTAHSRRPVILVGPAAPAARRVVLGTDDAETGGDTLVFAFEEAQLRHCDLHAVLLTEADADAVSRFEWTMALWRERYPAVQVTVHLDTTAEALRSASGDGALVVLGRAAAPPLGPVAEDLLHATTHPLAVVHPHA